MLERWAILCMNIGTISNAFFTTLVWRFGLCRGQRRQGWSKQGEGEDRNRGNPENSLEVFRVDFVRLEVSQILPHSTSQAKLSIVPSPTCSSSWDPWVTQQLHLPPLFNIWAPPGLHTAPSSYASPVIAAPQMSSTLGLWLLSGLGPSSLLTKATSQSSP